MIIHIKPDYLSDAQTDEMIKAGARHGVFRQCSIGYHDECSDPAGEQCRCPCHRGAR